MAFGLTSDKTSSKASFHMKGSPRLHTPPNRRGNPCSPPRRVACNRLIGDDPAAIIRTALEQWRDDFNARRTAHICELFAPDLRYDFQGLPEQTYPLLCERLHRALANHAQSIRYGLKIKEIMVSGDLAVVRLTWISTIPMRLANRPRMTRPGSTCSVASPMAAGRSFAISPIPQTSCAAVRPIKRARLPALPVSLSRAHATGPASHRTRF